MVFSFPSVAAASVVVGQSCDQLGASMMTSDQQNIAVCLKDTSGNLVWKASTDGSGGQTCGLAFMAPYTANPSQAEWGQENSISNQILPINVFPCEGQDIFRNFVPVSWNADPRFPYKYDKACPSGYTLKTGSNIPTGAMDTTRAYLAPYYCKKN